MKTIIIGNSGSGKTWLAMKLAAIGKCEVIHLDNIFWKPGGFNEKRAEEDVAEIIERSKKNQSWIVEGVFGELAESYFNLAESLIWLDIQWDICCERLLKRGSESKKHMGREQSNDSLNTLIKWASEYKIRTDLRSHSGHNEMFNKFDKLKFHFTAEEEVTQFIAENSYDQ